MRGSRHEGKPHHRGRSGRCRRLMDSVRASHSARIRGEQSRASGGRNKDREAIPRGGHRHQRGVAQPQARSVRPHRGRPQGRELRPHQRPAPGIAGSPRLDREERRHHRHPVGRCARGAGAAGQGAARAAHDRTGCEAAAGCDQRHSAAGAQQLGSAAQGCARPRLRRPRPSATAASSPRRGTASSPRFRRSALRRSPSPARRSRRSSVSIRCLPWSRCPSARLPTSRSATSPR